MKSCAYCGQDVKDRVEICPVCKRPITPPKAEVFPELRAPRHKKGNGAQEEARARAEAERRVQEAMAPDDPAEELHRLEEKNREAIRDKRTMAAAAYTGILFFVPWYACKNKKYGVFHANQGLVLLILLVAGFVLNAMIGESAFGRTLCFGYFGGLFYLMALGAIRGLRGKMIPLPIIGGIKIIHYRERRKD